MRVEISTEPTTESIDAYRVTLEVPDSSGVTHAALVQAAVEMLQDLIPVDPNLPTEEPVRLHGSDAAAYGRGLLEECEEPGPPIKRGGIKYEQGAEFANVAKMEPRFLAILRGPSMEATLLGQGNRLDDAHRFAADWILSHPIEPNTDVLIVDVLHTENAITFARTLEDRQ